MSNFDQAIAAIVSRDSDIVVKLGYGWDVIKDNQRAFTQVEYRRALRKDGILHRTPGTHTFKVGGEGHAYLVQLGDTAETHIKRFEDMAARRKAEKAAVNALNDLKKVLGI